MPPQQAETPQKHSRGSRRPPRKSANSTPSHIPSVQDFSQDPSGHRDSDQPTRILRRGDHGTPPEINVAGNLELPDPITPPRPRSMYDGLPNGQYQGNQSAPDTNPRRKKGRKSQGGSARASGARRPDPKEAPITPRAEKALTPSRSTGTPVKAYAGPTFHASPAASSLPLPTFFSRSVPNVDKTSSLKSMMDQESLDTTSESDSSPSLENTQPTQDHQPRENSPLDIFFQADRAAKAKALAASPAGLNGLRSESENDVRHHSRQATDSSLGGMFPLEMDGATPETPGSAHANKPSTPAPMAITEADYRGDQRKAQTLELKKLLYSPKPQRPASSSSRADTPSQGLISPSPKTSLRGGSPGLIPDATSTDRQRHAALLALAQKQIAGISTSNTPATQRQPSSKLRKEISIPSPPGIQPPELPATPTQYRGQKKSHAAIGHTQQHSNGYASPCSPFSTAFTPEDKPPGRFQSTPSRNSKDAKSIEEDLRRILKLDVLGADGVTGVQS